VNGEDRRRKVAFLLLALAAVMAVASAAFAVTIGLTSADVDQLGGTGNVDVLCPANPCQISRVKWVLTSSGPYGPYLVDRVQVNWQTRETSGASYTVYVTLLDSSNNPISGGSATQSAQSSAVTTTVDVTPNVDPAQVYKVQIVIVQN
jgi:hypothetical protein